VRKELVIPPLSTPARPMNLTEKILASKLLPGQGAYVKPGDAVLVKVDAGYSHEFTTAQVDLPRRSTSSSPPSTATPTSSPIRRSSRCSRTT
jgi:hypothetical protein